MCVQLAHLHRAKLQSWTVLPAQSLRQAPTANPSDLLEVGECANYVKFHWFITAFVVLNREFYYYAT